jgi:NIMA (never in mitosis gene a)-related kinase
VKRISDGKIYALKKVSNYLSNALKVCLGKLNHKEKENALNEVRILASIKHKNIIAYKQAFFED